MKFLGLNSPEIFLISAIILTILGSKRIEKGWLLFQRLLLFLLSNEEVTEVKSEEPKVTEGKEEVIEEVIEVKSEEPKVTEGKEEVTEVKSEEPKVTEGKEEVTEVVSEKAETAGFKEEVLKPNSEEEKPKVKRISKRK